MKFGRYDYAAFSCFTGYACCSVVVPVVLIELARSLNFPLTDGGMGAGGALQLGRSIPMVFAMLFCGFAAGRWGKVPTLGVSLLIMAAGIMLASAAPAYGLLFLAVAIAGLGEGVIEGLATPVVQDLHEHEEPGRYINFAHSFWSIGVVVTVLAAGALLSWGVSWRFILLLAGVLALVPALLFLLPSRGARHPDKPEKLHWTTVWGHATALMKQSRFWLFFRGDDPRRRRGVLSHLLGLELHPDRLCGFAVAGRTGYRGIRRRHDCRTHGLRISRRPAAPPGFDPLDGGGRDASLALPAAAPFDLDPLRAALLHRHRHRAVLAEHPELLCGPDSGRFDDDLHPALLCRSTRLRPLRLADGGGGGSLRIACQFLPGARLFRPARSADRRRMAAAAPESPVTAEKRMCA
ncbi:MAG: MFS transporter [Lentisphaeria bacterium]|nr:MAG: MFS transporter [Lentisphaeria bacterium]